MLKKQPTVVALLCANFRDKISTPVIKMVSAKQSCLGPPDSRLSAPEVCTAGRMLMRSSSSSSSNSRVTALDVWTNCFKGGGRQPLLHACMQSVKVAIDVAKGLSSLVRWVGANESNN
jgi:hypothetical protein